MSAEPETFPAWRYGPNEQAAVFNSEADVPKGWADHPSKVAGPDPLDHDDDGRKGGSRKKTDTPPSAGEAG